MPKIILTIGASSSGKSSWAEDFVRNRKDWVNINRDDVRFWLFNQGKRDWTKYKFNKENESRVTTLCEQYAFDACMDLKNIIISDTNLNQKTREMWKAWAEKRKYEYEEKLFPCGWEELVKRNAQREGGLKESLLWSQYMRYEQQFGNIKLFESDNNLEPTVICDIDGTIAEKGDRSPFDWDKVGNDTVRYEVLSMVEALGNIHHHITFLSGRDSVCYNTTYDWLKTVLTDNNYSWDLYMRSEGDSRRDSIVKDELYENHIRGRYNPVAVFDDRPQMIRHWTIKGLPNIINVGNYGEEF